MDRDEKVVLVSISATLYFVSLLWLIPLFVTGDLSFIAPLLGFFVPPTVFWIGVSFYKLADRLIGD